MATQTEQQRKATARRPPPPASATPPSAASRARKAAETRAQAELSTVAAVQAQAERAVLIPVGAALVARDSLARGRQAATSTVARAPRRS